MASVSVKLDRDLEARVSKYADGIGVPLEKLVERALVYAISSLYPDNALPGQPARPDQGLPGEQPKPDQGLPGQQPRPDQGLPRPPFNGHIDNTLPDGEIPDQSLPGEQPEAGQDLPGRNPNPNPDVDVDLSAGGPKPTPYKK